MARPVNSICIGCKVRITLDAVASRPREPAPEAWARCRPYLQAALEHASGTHGIEDVAQLVEEGRAQFWPGARCAVVTEFYDYPKLRACNFWLLGGDLTELLAMLPAIEAWARWMYSAGARPRSSAAAAIERPVGM